MKQRIVVFNFRPKEDWILLSLFRMVYPLDCPFFKNQLNQIILTRLRIDKNSYELSHRFVPLLVMIGKNDIRERVKLHWTYHPVSLEEWKDIATIFTKKGKNDVNCIDFI